MLLLGIATAQDQNKWTGHIEFFAKPGSDRSLAKGDLFLPLQQSDDVLVFGNLKANFDDHSYREGNAGIGVRKLYDEWIAGGWVFYDWKESETSNSFDQMTVGAELLSNDWDFRTNLYFAENNRKDADDASVIELRGNQIGARLGEERALPGVDFEIGRKLPYFKDSRFYLGAYHYDASDFEKVSGPKLRLEMRFDDLPLLNSISKDARLTLGAEYTEDSVRGSESFGLLQLRIPFGGKRNSRTSSLSSLEKRMVETVKRDDDILTSERVGDQLVPIYNPKTGQVINVVETVNATTTNVASAVSTAGENSLIIADGSQGEINLGGTTINTQPGQIIVGGGQQITLQAKKPNGDLVSMAYTPAGERGSISRTGNGELIYINSDNDVTINGVDLAGGRSIRINNSQNVCVANTNVLSSATNRQGVYIHNNSDVNFTNITINNIGRQGVLVTSNSTANFTKLSILNTNREGVYLTSNSSAVFNDLSIENTAREGIELAGSTAVLQNVDISNTRNEGMRIRSGSTVIANNLSITKSGSEAIEVNNSNLDLRNASITDIDVNANRDGIYATNGSILDLNNILIDNVTSQGIISNNSTVSLTDVNIKNTRHQGIYAYNNSTINMANVDVSNVTSQGIYTRDATLSAENVNVDNTTRQGIYMLRTNADLREVGIVNAAQQSLYVNNTTATVDDLSIRDSGFQGMYITGNSVMNFVDIDIQNSGRQGVYANRATFNGKDLSIKNSANQGLYLNNTTSNLENLNVDTSTHQGIYLNRNTNATINNAAITNSAREGLYVRDSDLLINNASISDITASANRDGIFIYRDSNVTLNDVSVSNVTGDGLQVYGRPSTAPIVNATNLNITNASNYGVVNTYGDITLNNVLINSTGLDGILVNRGNLTLDTATVSNTGRYGVYALRSNATMQDLTVTNTAQDGVLINRSTVFLTNSTIRDIGDGGAGDDAIQVTNSNVAGAGNRIEGFISNGLACRSTGTNTGSIGFSSGPITSCP